MSVGRALRIDSQADAPTNVENGGRNDRKPRRHLGEDLEMFCKRVTEADTAARADGRLSLPKFIFVRVTAEDTDEGARPDEPLKVAFFNVFDVSRRMKLRVDVEKEETVACVPGSQEVVGGGSGVVKLEGNACWGSNLASDAEGSGYALSLGWEGGGA